MTPTQVAAASAPAPLGASPIVPYESKTKAKLATLNGDVDYKKVPKTKTKTITKLKQTKTKNKNNKGHVDYKKVLSQ